MHCYSYYIAIINSCNRSMMLLGTLVLCAAALTGITGLPQPDVNQDAAMRDYEASLQEAFEELEIEQHTSDAEMAIQEAGELFEGDIEDEDGEYDMDDEMFNDNTEEMSEEFSKSEGMVSEEHQDEDNMLSEEDLNENETLYEDEDDEDETFSEDLDEDKMLSEMDEEDMPFMQSKTQGTVEEAEDEPAANIEEVELFEGDIEITHDEILRAYDPEDIQKIMNITVNKDDVKLQAATSSSSKLWPRGVVPYNFHSSLSSSRRTMILSAIRAWRDATCLRFMQNYTT